MTKITLPNAKRSNIVTVRLLGNKKVLLGKAFVVKSVELLNGGVIIKYTYKK